MKRLIAIFLTTFIVACAPQTRIAPEVPPSDQTAEKLHAAIQELKGAEARIAALQLELAACRKNLAGVEADLEANQARIAELEATIKSLERSLAQPRSAELDALRDQLAASRAAESRALQALDALAAEHQAVRDELDATQEAYASMASDLEFTRRQSGGAVDPRIAAGQAMAVQVDDDNAIVKRVFYATNRVQLERSWLDFVFPLTLPLLLVLVARVVLWGNRRYIKERYQRRVRYSVITVAAIAFLFSVGLAFQKIIQTAQRDLTLTTQYGNELRSVAGESHFERGFVDVSIPSRRPIGSVPRPELLKFEFVVDATKHFQLKSILPSSADEFYEQLNVAAAGDAGSSAFVFVHGFHNTFADAAFRTAQIAHDMKFDGAPIFFSWPSQGAVFDYLTDAKNVETSVVHLRSFLEELYAETGATRIHLIAHSMGSRALSQAVEDLQHSMDDTSKLGELVFAAPDIAKDLLEQKVAALDQITSGVTLYASANDSALLLSRALQGQDQQHYQRAGETHPRPMVALPMQTIDVSDVTNGHSYIADSAIMMRDLAGLLDGTRILDDSSENYQAVDANSGYWKLAE